MINGYIKYISSCFQIVPTGVSIGMLVIFCFGSVFLLAFLGFKNGVKWSAGLLLLEYLALLFFLTVLFRSVRDERTFNLMPFWSYHVVRRGKHALLLTQIIMNVVAFIPIGLLLGCAFDRMKWWKVLLIGGAFSLLIETLQFVLKRGFAEVDDVWHNVIGCLVGYGVYRGIVCIVEWIAKRRLSV